MKHKKHIINYVLLTLLLVVLVSFFYIYVQVNWQTRTDITDSLKDLELELTDEKAILNLPTTSGPQYSEAEIIEIINLDTSNSKPTLTTAEAEAILNR